MTRQQDLPATDSAAVLHDLVGDDSTAAFENDPKFIDGNPTVDASSENLQVPKDRGDMQNLPDMQAAPRSKALDEEDDDEDEEIEDDEDDDYEDVETEDDDEDDEDELDDDDLEDDDEDDDDEDDEDEDEE